MKHSRSRVVRTLIALSVGLGILASSVAAAGPAQAENWTWPGAVTSGK